MYTEKEKANALTPYDKTKSIAEGIRRLGYPSRQATYTRITNRKKNRVANGNLSKRSIRLASETSFGRVKMI